MRGFRLAVLPLALCKPCVLALVCRFAFLPMFLLSYMLWLCSVQRECRRQARPHGAHSRRKRHVSCSH